VVSKDVLENVELLEPKEEEGGTEDAENKESKEM